ncbi:MAG: SelB C-terminal domain-containing protein, partial [Deltaproteobacteria bacterium]|nr:SelB C-terminal domain-containing protein [Deltaproteobacteria bacterium]
GCLCQLRLAHPIAALAGDPYVLRGFEVLPGYGRTVGGGRILQPDAPFRRGAAAVAAAPLLAALRDGDAAGRLLALVELSGASGLAAPDLLARSDLGQRAVNRALGPLVSSGRVLHFQRDGVTRYAGVEACGRLSETLLAALAAAHERHPDRDGIPVDEQRGALPSRPEVEVLALALGRLAAAGKVREAAPGAFALPGHSARSSRVGEDMLSRVEAVFAAAGLSPPYPDEAAAALGLPPAGVRDAVTSLVRQGRLVRVTGAAGEQPLHFHAPALAAARDRLIAHMEARGPIAMAAFKDLLGVTRKYAIPLAEHFDSAHVTLRMPDGTRKLRR